MSVNIEDAASARAWLAAWGGRPRDSYLSLTLRSQRACVSLSMRPGLEVTRAGHLEAVEVLEQAWKAAHP